MLLSAAPYAGLVPMDRYLEHRVLHVDRVRACGSGSFLMIEENDASSLTWTMCLHWFLGWLSRASPCSVWLGATASYLCKTCLCRETSWWQQLRFRISFCAGIGHLQQFLSLLLGFLIWTQAQLGRPKRRAWMNWCCRVKRAWIVLWTHPWVICI